MFTIMTLLQKHSVLSWRLGGSNVFLAISSLTSAATALPIVQRRTYGSDPLQLRQFSGISRASRGIKMSIRRIKCKIFANFALLNQKATPLSRLDLEA
jgi:hypothetical protein